MTKDPIPEKFILSLALVDALPVLFFGGSINTDRAVVRKSAVSDRCRTVLLGRRGKSTMEDHRHDKGKEYLVDVPTNTYRYADRLFVVIFNRSVIDLHAVFPSVLFFAIGVIGIVLMGGCGNTRLGGRMFQLDRSTDE